MALEITDANFQKVVLDSDKPVLVDFWATWCGPCRTISPIIDELATELEGKAVVGKVNVDDNSLSDHLYFQSGFASRQCIIENDKVLIVGGTRINIYDRLQLDNDPISMDFPIYPAYSRFGTALQEDQVFLIGGAL